LLPMVPKTDMLVQPPGYPQPQFVAHRGVTERELGNTLPAFLRALELGADAVELDVRLTADQVPVVFHNFYMDGISTLTGPIFEHSWSELSQARLVKTGDPQFTRQLSTLQEVLEALNDRIGLEIEIKGPEPDCVERIVGVLNKFSNSKKNLEVTSSEPILLERFRRLMPMVPTDLLIPLSEPWMKSDVLAYIALQRGRMAGARAVHLHASQLTIDVVSKIRQGGCEVHAWGINDPHSYITARELNIPRLCTDNLEQILKYHKEINHETIQ
jgi:glycerophosphoryl diester phosphodiesterase